VTGPSRRSGSSFSDPCSPPNALIEWTASSTQSTPDHIAFIIASAFVYRTAALLKLGERLPAGVADDEAGAGFVIADGQLAPDQPTP